MDGWMDGCMHAWIARHDCKILTFLFFYIDTFILQSLNLSSYLHDQLIWSYLCHPSKSLSFHLSLSKRKCSLRNLT